MKIYKQAIVCENNKKMENHQSIRKLIPERWTRDKLGFKAKISSDDCFKLKRIILNIKILFQKIKWI